MTSVWIGDNGIVLEIPFSRASAKVVRRYLPDARWDRITETWNVSILERDAALAVAKELNLNVETGVLKVPVPKNIKQPKTLRIYRKRVRLSFPYEEDLVAAVRQIEGVQWDSAQRVWSAPYESLPEAIIFARLHDFDIENDIEMHEQAVLQMSRDRAEAFKHSSALTGDIRVPGLTLELHDYQRAAIEYILDKKKVLQADDMGLGKTVSSLAAVEAAGAFPCLLVVPSGLMGDWTERTLDWLPERSMEILEGRNKSGVVGPEFTIVGDANLASWKETLLEQKFAGIIVDEAHMYKNKKSSRSSALSAIIRNSKTSNSIVVLLTGTPAENNPAELGPQLELIGMVRQFGGLWGYYKQYCGAHRDRFGNWHTTGKDLDHSKLVELNRRLRETCYIRRTKQEVMSDLPKLNTVKRLIPLPDRYKSRYRTIESELDNKQGGFLKFKAEASQLLAEAKVTAALPFIQELLDQEEKVVVVAHHKKIIEELTDALGPLKIDGSVSTNKRNQIKKQFSEPGARTLVISDDAASTGHDLTAAHNIVFIEMPWNPSKYDQLVSRVHRQGQVKDVTSTIFLVENTYDEQHYQMIVNKEETTSRTNQGQVSHEMRRVQTVET